MRYLIHMGLVVALLGLGGCENMGQFTKTFEDINKTLAPLAVIKKGS